MNKYRLVAPIDDSDRNQNTVLGFPGKSYIRFICLFVSKCLQFYFYSGQTDRQTLSFIYIDDLRQKHFFTDCKQSKSKNPEQKLKTAIDAAKCFNCFSSGHFSRECTFSSKCRLCEPHFDPKHSTALHKIFRLRKPLRCQVGACQISVTTGAEKKQTDVEQTVVRKLAFNHDFVMLCTSAVRVINPVKSKSTLSYAQHDTTSRTYY